MALIGGPTFPKVFGMNQGPLDYEYFDRSFFFNRTIFFQVMDIGFAFHVLDVIFNFPGLGVGIALDSMKKPPRKEVALSGGPTWT
ncbi:MAG: hypothetical protein U5L09_17070 [Bacteroidales bacterium]|nr:hypothetical protein [Bacteroidales bacterium]